MARKINAPVRKAAQPSPSPQPAPQPRPARQAQVMQRQPARQMQPTMQRGGGQPQRQLGPSMQRGGGQPGSYGSYLGGSPGAMSADMGGMQPMTSAPSEEDYLAGDGSYQSQFAALKGALERYLADSDLQRTNYNTDYTSSLRDLGYDEGQKTWNWNDQLTASGKAYQNQLNDFASRGMLQSQGYADAATDLERMFNQQYQQTATNKTNFMTGLDRETANYKGENTAAQQAARAEAIARRAAQYGL